MKTKLLSTSKYNSTKYLNKHKKNKESILLLEGLKRGEKAILNGRTFTHSEAKKRMSHWLD